MNGPNANWKQAPDGSWWYLAADGRWYPQETAGGRPQTDPWTKAGVLGILGIFGTVFAAFTWPVWLLIALIALPVLLILGLAGAVIFVKLLPLFLIAGGIALGLKVHNAKQKGKAGEPPWGQ